MSIASILDSEYILTPAQFLRSFLSPKTVEGHFIIREINKKTIQEALDLADFFTEEDTKNLSYCVDPGNCFLLITLMITRIRQEQTEKCMSAEQKQETLERFYKTLPKE